MHETPRDSVSPRDETLFPFLPVNEAARRMGMSRATIYRRMDAGLLGYTEEGGRRLIPIAEIQKYSESLLALVAVA
jgi:excisionase family DNA binding protein